MEQEPKVEKPIISKDANWREYEGGEIVQDGIKPDDFDSTDPLTTDAEGHLIRGAKLKESSKSKAESGNEVIKKPMFDNLDNAKRLLSMMSYNNVDMTEEDINRARVLIDEIKQNLDKLRK